MTFAAYLRVYVPGDGRHVVEHVPPSRARVLWRGAYGVWFEPVREDAFVIEREGRRYVCPRHPRLRMLEGLLAFRNAYPAPVSSSLVPESLARRAAVELDRIHARQPGVRSHILTSPFHIPPRWLAAFNPKERELVSGPVGLSIRYRTTRSASLRRLQRAARILERAGFDEEAVEQVRELIEWLRPFPSESLVELDYGGAAGLFSDGELATDETAEDVAASLRALQREDFDAAAEHYRRVAMRWAHPQALTFAS
ncbi:MAG: hypothetical protein JW785_10635 [Acidimicrobiia bacterium]|nr:hypothetical protein [Acidimicrobiia bacterium]